MNLEFTIPEGATAEELGAVFAADGVWVKTGYVQARIAELRADLMTRLRACRGADPDTRARADEYNGALDVLDLLAQPGLGLATPIGERIRELGARRNAS